MKKTSFIFTVTAAVMLLLTAVTCKEGMFGSLKKLEQQAIEENAPKGNQTYTVTVSPDTALVTRGGSQQFTATVHGDGEPSQAVTWSVEGGAKGSSVNETGLLSVAADEEPGTILTVTAASVAYKNNSGTAVAEVSALVNAQTPVFTVQPKSETAYTQGAAAIALTGAASAGDGGAITYQWYSNTEDSNTDGISLGAANGAQTPSYVPGTASSGTVYYYVTATNTIANNGDGGIKAATAASNTAAVTVNTLVNAQPPDITGQPAATASYTRNAPAAALTVEAESPDGGQLSYQWYSNSSNSNSGGTSLGAANGAQTAKYTPLTTAVGTVYYYAVITNTIADNGDGGNKSATAVSNTAEVTVNALVNAQAPDISGQPEVSTTYTFNAAATALTVTAESPDGGQLSYQWYSNNSNSNSGGTSLGSARGAQTASYTPLTTAVGAVYYYAVITNTIADNGDGGNKTATASSNAAEVIINSQVNAGQPGISAQPVGATYAYNAVPAALTVTASSPDGGSLAYQWYSNGTDSNSGGTSLGSVRGANTASYTPLTTPAGTLYYYVIITNTIADNFDGGNKTATRTSNTAVVTVNTQVNAVPPAITGQPASSAVYTEGAAPAVITVTANSNDGGSLSYQWYSNGMPSNSGGTSLGSVRGANTASYTPLTTTPGTLYYYVIVTNTINNNGDGGQKTATATSNLATVTVNAIVNAGQPIINNQPAGASYAQGATSDFITVTAASPDGGQLSYQWYSNGTNNNTGGTLLSGMTNAYYSPSTSSTGTMYYYVVVTNTIPPNGDGGTKTASIASNCAMIVVSALVNAVTPTINTQPAVTTTYTYRDTANALSVAASITDSGTLSYQWYSNTSNNNAGGTPISGATNATYTPLTTTAGTLYYYVIVTNTNNNVNGVKTAALSSNTATVIVNKKALTIATATHTKAYDGNTSTTGAAVTLSGVLSGDTVTPGAVTATYTTATAGSRTLNITAVATSGASAANYAVTVNVNVTMTTGGITAKPVSLSVGTPTAPTTITPIAPSTIFSVYSSDFVAGETVTVDIANLSSYGLSVYNNTNTGVGNSSSKTITLNYNGTTAVTVTSFALSLSISGAASSNYSLYSSAVNLTLYDGQVTGARAVPITKANIADFNKNVNTVNNLKRHYKLEADIVATDLRTDLGANNNWAIVGAGTDAPFNDPQDWFSGSFDGQGHTITGLKLNNTTAADIGMFGGILGTVKNLGLVNCSVTGTNRQGGIAGRMSDGSIEYCFVTGTISGSSSGGIAGYADGGTVKNSYFNGTVTGTTGYAGGIAAVGFSVENCYAMGTVSGDTSGGILGAFTSVGPAIKNCYAVNSVNSTGYGAGGIVGRGSQTNTKIDNCVALNNSVKTSNSDDFNIGRIIGEDGTKVGPNVMYKTTKTNVYARSSGMTLTYGGATYSPVEATSTGKDGTSATTYTTGSWWTGTVGFSTINWNCPSSGLPTLVGMPTGTQNPTVP